MIHRLNLHRSYKLFLLAAFLLAATACDDAGRSEQLMLQSAKSHLDKGELIAASLELRNTLQKNDGNAEARYLLGSINLRVGDLAKAEKEFRQAANAGWSQQAVQLQLARIFIRKKAFTQLLEEIKPDDAWSVDTRANIAGLRALAEAGQNNIVEAKVSLDEGKALNENATQVLRSTAILQLAGALQGSASDTLDTAVTLHPDDPEILLLYAANDIRNKQLTRAADTFSKVIALEPAKTLTSYGRKARIGLARLQIIDKNYRQADTTLAPILKNSNKDPEADYLAGLLAFTQGSFNRAEDYVRKVLTILPDNIQAHRLMGKIKYALKDFEQAAHHFSEYLNFAPNDNTVRKLLANTYIISNRPEQARYTLQSVFRTDPDDAAAHILLSQIEFNTGHMDAGIAALGTAIKSSPENAQLHKQLAQAYIRTAQTKLAQSEIATYLKLSNDTEGASKLAISAYLQAGQTGKALDIANKMLTKNPEDPDTLTMLGKLYAVSGKNQLAHSYFNKAIEIQQGHPSATVGLARIETQNGNVDKATLLYKGLVDAKKAGAVPMLALSEIAARQQRPNDMIYWLEKARSTAPAEIRARILLARYYLQKAQPEKAEIYVKEAIKQSPEQVEVIILQATILIAQKRFNEAIPLLKKLVAKFPQSTDAQNLLGEAFLRQHKLAEARDHLLETLKNQPNNFIATSLLAETELKDGNFEKSLEFARALQKQRPDHYIGYMLEGDAWMAKNTPDQALAAYYKAWTQQHTALLAKRLYLASKNTSNIDKSITPLLTWLKNNPDDASTRLYLASIYQSADKNDKAIDEYKKVLKQAPDNSAVLNNLAWLYSLKGHPAALDMAERAYRLAPDNPGILDTYGWILLQQGQLEKGRRLIKLAMDVLPENPDIRYHYATALLKSGNDAEAKQMLEQLLKQDLAFDNREEVKRLLKNL